MNQGKLEVVKQEMARVNINIYCGQESLRRNGVTIIVNERVWNVVLECNLKMTE